MKFSRLRMSIFSCSSQINNLNSRITQVKNLYYELGWFYRISAATIFTDVSYFIPFQKYLLLFISYSELLGSLADSSTAYVMSMSGSINVPVLSHFFKNINSC